MDNKNNNPNGELSTEELIKRLMENFKDEDEAKEEADSGETLLKEDPEGEILEFEDVPEEEPVIVSEEPLAPEETVGTEKFKFRVQKSTVARGAAIPRVADSWEGALEEEVDPASEDAPEASDVSGDAEEDAFLILEEIEADDAPSEQPQDSYEQIDQVAKDVLEEEKAQEQEQEQEENIFAQEHSEHFGQLSEDDVNLMMIFGEEGQSDKEENTAADSDEKSEVKRNAEDEYDDPAKKDSFYAMYRRKYSWMNIRVVLSVILLLVCGVIECVGLFGGELPGMLNANNYPEIHLLISVQLTLFCGFVALPEIIYSVRSALRGCPGPGILLTLGVSFNLIYEIMLAVSQNHVGTPTFNLPLSLCAFMAVLGSWMHLKSEMMSFDVISAEGVKYTATRQKDAESAMEKDAFDQFLDEKPRIFGIQKTAFVSDFVSGTQKYAKEKSICGVIAALDVIVAVVFLILGYYRTGTLLDGLGYCQLALMFCLPISAFLVFGFPMYRASRKAYSIDCAIVGEASVDEYADSSVVSFNDSDVFPASGVKVRSIKLYGNSRIDKVLYTVSGVFEKLGGPLADVFGQATKSFGMAADVDLLENKPGGVEAAVDGVHVHCGNGAYINSCGFVPAYEPNDVAIEHEGKLSIMFVVIGKELAAKMYIEYRMDPEMKGIVSALYKAGMCMGIRTLDPNIDDTMLGRRIRLTEYPVRVLKCENKEQLSGVAERTKSGVVSRRNAKNLLKTLSLCDRTRLFTRICVAIKVLSVAAGITAISLVYAFGSLPEISSMHVLAYQLFWLIPTYFLPMLFI